MRIVVLVYFPTASPGSLIFPATSIDEIVAKQIHHQAPGN